MYNHNRYRDESIMSTALKFGIGAVAVYAGASILSSLLKENSSDNRFKRDVQEIISKNRDMCFDNGSTDDYVVNDNTPLEEPIACSLQ